MYDEINSQVEKLIEKNGGVQDDQIQEVRMERSSQGMSNDMLIFDAFISIDDVEEAVPTELERYLSKPVSSVNTPFDLESWWWQHRNEYPNLFNMYVRLSCIPATSASSERDFSIAGCIVTDRRSRILPENVNDLIVARNNM